MFHSFNVTLEDAVDVFETQSEPWTRPPGFRATACCLSISLRRSEAEHRARHVQGRLSGATGMLVELEPSHHPVGGVHQVLPELILDHSS